MHCQTLQKMIFPCGSHALWLCGSLAYKRCVALLTRGSQTLPSLPTGERVPPELVPRAELRQQGRVHARDCRGASTARLTRTQLITLQNQTCPV